MEILNEKATRLFSNSELSDLQNALPGKYYEDFERIWSEKYIKGKPKNEQKKCPVRQNVYAVLNGLSENDRILAVLIEMVRERNELRKELLSVTKNVREPETATAN